MFYRTENVLLQSRIRSDTNAEHDRLQQNFKAKIFYCTENVLLQSRIRSDTNSEHDRLQKNNEKTEKKKKKNKKKTGGRRTRGHGCCTAARTPNTAGSGLSPLGPPSAEGKKKKMLC